MKIDEIISLLDCEIISRGKRKKINKIEIDSRKVKKNDLFIALKGNNFDGHDYIKDIIKKCSLIIVSKDIKIKGTNIIKVNDTNESLKKISSYLRKKYNNLLIAITGSNGKTTTKELTYKILKTKYKVLKNYGNNNNYIGLAKTLFKLNNKYDYVITELGTNHEGEMSELVNICNPDISVITNIGLAHIGNFKTKENIFKEKINIIKNNPNHIIVNGDDYFLKNIEGIKCGLNKNNNLYAFNIKERLNGITFNININNKTYLIKTKICSKNLITDILLSINIGLICNIKIKKIIKSIKKFKMPDQRMKKIKKKSNIIIDDTYNASLESIYSLLNIKTNKDKVIILGDIFEIGDFENKIYTRILNRLKKEEGNILLVGEKFYKYKNKYLDFNFFTDKEELISYLKNIKFSNNIILIKASHLMHLESITAYLIKNI